MEISLIFSLIAVVALGICVILLFRAIASQRKEYDMLLQSYNNMESLNQKLRAQRHDYLNHLQVVIGMLELEEYDNLKKYLDPVYQDIQKTGKALKTSKPAINALLAAKTNEAEARGIDVYLQIKSNLEDLSVKDWELCKVLSNIFDNAVTALDSTDDTREKKIVVDITEDKNRYIFEISNNGPMIPKEMQKSIFQFGVTSKKEEGHGVGLAVVDKVVHEHNGKISLLSNETETRFVVEFDKQKGDDSR